jgi:hypothetical protein
MTKPKYQYPGKIDPLVAGCINARSTVRSTLVSEAWEESSMPSTLAGNAVFRGYISYLMQQHSGVKNQILFSFDLDLTRAISDGWRPKSRDHSVDSYIAVPAEEAADLLRHTDDFKGGSNLVTLDFLIRNGIVRQDEKDYYAICSGLRRQLLVRSDPRIRLRINLQSHPSIPGKIAYRKRFRAR